MLRTLYVAAVVNAVVDADTEMLFPLPVLDARQMLRTLFMLGDDGNAVHPVLELSESLVAAPEPEIRILRIWTIWTTP